MKSQKSFKEKRAVSLRFRFLVTVIVAMLAIAVLIGGLSLYEVDNYVKAQAEDFVKVTCDNEAEQINGSLKNMQKSVMIMESYLMDFFTDGVDYKNPAFQEKVIKSADQMFVDIAKHTTTKGAVAYYFRFDPAISNNKSGIFYNKLNGSDEFVPFELTDLSLYSKDDTERVGWFWQPYEAGEPVWMQPYHNQNNDVCMISYVVPMYYNGTFIGIIGMDFDYNALFTQVKDIKLYENGFAHLEIDGEVVSDDAYKFKISDNTNLSNYMSRSKELVNGMTLVLSASYDDISQIRHDITYKILFGVLVLSGLFMVLAVYVVKKIVDPLKKLTDASVKLANGDYNVEIAYSNTYEIKLLSTAFENMTMRLHEREEQLHLVANRDSLTGLRNTTSYSAWVAKFDDEIKGKNADFGVIVLDINNLKTTNDMYGHAVGDKLIIEAAKVIADTFENCPVFRIGGDEFLVVIEKDDLKNYEKLLNNLVENCANTFVEETDHKIPVRIAGGFAKFDLDSDSRFLDVFKRADDAMYENKGKIKSDKVRG